MSCCDSDIKQLIVLLAQAESFGIRTFMTSRPDDPVIPAFTRLQSTQYRKVILETHTEAAINHDISLFLTLQLSNLRSNEPGPCERLAWERSQLNN